MFKLVHENKNGSFKIALNRDVSDGEMVDLCRLAAKLVPGENQSSEIQYGPHPPQQNLLDRLKNHSDEANVFIQSALGEKPVDKINMGAYREPIEGVRIKMLHLVQRSIVISVVKALRKHTDISIVGCKDIVYGNFPCPTLTLNTAQAILEEWRALGVFAKIVPAESIAA